VDEEEVAEELESGLSPGMAEAVAAREEAAGQSWQVSHIPTNSPREELLQELIISGELSVRQAQSVLELTDDDTHLGKVTGLVAGEFGVAPRKIEQALDGTDYDHVNVAMIDEQKRSFLQSAGGIGGNVVGGLQTWLTWPLEAAASGISAGLGIENAPLEMTGEGLWGVTVTDKNIMKEDAWYAGAPEEERADREKVRDDTMALISQMADKGLITEEQETHMLSVTDNYDPGTARDLHVEISGILEDVDYETQGIDFKRLWSSSLNGLQSRSEGLVPSAGAEAAAEEAAAEAEAAAVIEAQEAQAASDPIGDYGSFDQLLGQLGIAGEQVSSQGIKDTDKVEIGTISTRLADGSVITTKGYDLVGPDRILDRATGTVMTNEMYNIIRRNETIAADYSAMGKPAPAIQELLDSGMFRDPTKVPGLTGKAFMPLEDLGIASVSPTAPWQRDAYNWTAGSGSAQWQSMSARSRRANTKYMVDSGMVPGGEVGGFDNPFSLAGGRQWEQILGVSREKQIAPQSAMNVIGAEVNRVRDIASQYSSGGGYGSASAPKYSVPASLRTIPDYKSLAQQTKSSFLAELGRDMEDWELALMSDVLGEAYKKRNTQLISADRAAWEDAVSGGTVSVENIEVLDPAETLQFDIEDTYADELQRYDQVEDYGQSRGLLMDSIVTGQRMT